MLYLEQRELWSGFDSGKLQMAQSNRKTDYQTLSLFITLAVLTGLLAFGMKWVFLAPAAAVDSTQTESASK